MDTPTTCGQGLAANASLPSAMGDLIGALAEVLAHHMSALDLGDESSRAEHETYAALVLAFRESSMQMAAIAERMTGARALPMGRHDFAGMSSPDAAEVLRAMVEREDALRGLLERMVAEHRGMLDSMG